MNPKDAPVFTKTEYNTNFLNWEGKKTIEAVKPNEGKLMGGGSFSGKSVYRSDYNQRMSLQDKKRVPFKPNE